MLSRVLVLAVHLVNLFGWVGPGDHTKTFLPLELFWLEHSFIVKSWGWGGVVAHVIIVSAPVNRIGHLDFPNLVWTF